MRTRILASIVSLALLGVTGGLSQNAWGQSPDNQGSVEAEPRPPEAPPPAPAPRDEYRGPFSQGSVRGSILGGYGFTGGDNYLILGVGISYFIIHGLELGLESEFWLIGDPRIINLSPQARYVLYFIPFLQPYVGVFYRHAFVDGGDDYDSIGARVGAFLPFRYGSYLGIGAVFEKILNCPDYRNCEGWSPELTIGVSF